MLKRLKTDFMSSVLILVSGTVLAQAFTYLLSPIISRLYDPAEMSYLSLFSRIVTFLAVIATARFELAFPLPKRDEHAFSLYRVSVQITIITTVISILGVIGLSFIHWEDPNYYFLLLLIPLGLIILALNSQGQTWAIRIKDFRSISISKVMMSLMNSLASIGFALLNLGYKGVLLGYIVGLFSGTVVFIRTFLKTKKTNQKFLLKGRKFAIAKFYADFPTINLPHVLVDLSKELFIALYLIYTFEKDVLGLYDFSFRMLRMPVTLIGASISQVFFNKAADLVNKGESIYPLVKKTFLTLVALSIVPFTVLFFFGSDLFEFVFGRPWREAGVYSEIMAPWLMVNFLASPISQIPIILNKQRSFFILSLFGTGLLIFSLALGDIFPQQHFSFKDILTIVSAGQFFFLIFVTGWIIWLTRKYSHA